MTLLLALLLIRTSIVGPFLSGFVARHSHGAWALLTRRSHAWPDSLAAKVRGREVAPACVRLREGLSARESENRAGYPSVPAGPPRSQGPALPQDPV